MKVLLIKTSSLGDIIHLFPALTEAGRAIPNIRFDWVVEEAFAEVPSWHPLVDRVIVVAWRRWRRALWNAWRSHSISQFWRQLRQRRYDQVIDAQGLIKSAVISRCSRGLRVGFNRYSLREPLARLAYQRCYEVAPQQHAIDRSRQLLAAALGYTVSETVDYGLSLPAVALPPSLQSPYVLFLHGTTQITKRWPLSHWQALALWLQQQGIAVKVPWSNDEEKILAETLVRHCASVSVLPKCSINEIAAVIAAAKAVVAVDTGLGHCAAALSVPTISLYGFTKPVLIGTIGKNQYHCLAQQACAANCQRQYCALTNRDAAACMNSISVESVIALLQKNVCQCP